MLQSLCSLWWLLVPPSFFPLRHFIESSSRARVWKGTNDFFSIAIVVWICWFPPNPPPSEPSRVVYQFQSIIFQSGRREISSLVSLQECSNGFMSEKHFSQIPYHPATILSRQQICRFQSFSFSLVFREIVYGTRLRIRYHDLDVLAFPSLHSVSRSIQCCPITHRLIPWVFVCLQPHHN